MQNKFEFPFKFLMVNSKSEGFELDFVDLMELSTTPANPIMEGA